MQVASTISTSATPASRFGDTADLIARITLALLFVFSGADKLFFHSAGAVEYMRAVGLPLAGALVYPVGLLEFIGGLLLAFGYRTRIAAGVLAAFTVVATLLFHAFWAAPADQAVLQTIMFWKNLAIFGGLLLVVVHGSGRLSLGRG
jgi:putative oxidoreductase